MRVLDILVVLRLDLGQITFNLVENAFATRQLALLATSITFCDILARACAEIKTIPFPFSSFLFFLPLGLLAVKKPLRIIEAGIFYHAAARCSGSKFCSEFFTQL